MKIVCMDCQTETHSDLELLKDKRFVECVQCAEKEPAVSTNDVEKRRALSSDYDEKGFVLASDDLGFEPDSSRPSPFQGNILQLAEDDPLEIIDLPSGPALSDSTEVDEIISLPPLEPTHRPAAMSSSAIDGCVQPPMGNAFAQDSLQPFEAECAVEAKTAVQETLAEERLPQLFQDATAARPKGSRLLLVSTSVLLVVAGVFILFISLGDASITPGSVSRPSAAPAAAALPVSPAAQKREPQESVVVPVKSTEAVEAISVQASEVESSPAEANHSTGQSAEAEKGRFTVQFGSHNELEQADKQVEQLRGAGIEAHIVSVDLPSRGRWYRVQSGNFSSREEANSYGSGVVAQGAAKSFVLSAL